MKHFLREICWSSFAFLFIFSASGFAASATQTPKWEEQFIVQDTRLNELSGLSESIRYPGYFWANNDSGDSLRCFLISPKGETVAVVNLAPYKNIDIESLRVAGTAQQSFVYLSDTGDNRSRRKQVEIYRFVEPEIDVEKRKQEMTVSPEQMILQYKGGISTDAETLLIDRNQRVGIVTKSLLASNLWITPKPFSAEPQTLEMAGTIPLRKWRRRDQKFSLLFTDGAISNDGKQVALMTYTTVFIWRIADGMDLQDLAKVLSSPPMIDVNLPELQQPESLSFGGENRHIAVSSEGINPPVMTMNLSH